MSVARQAITGVSSSSETQIRCRYPSAAATALGRLVGQICESVPVRIWGVKLSYLLFALPLAPVGLLVYALQKIGGERYVLTNRSVQRWAAFGARQIQSVSLNSISGIDVRQLPGQEFFRAADVVLLNAKGDPLMTLAGVPQADILRRTILESRDARTLTEQSMATIAARA